MFCNYQSSVRETFAQERHGTKYLRNRNGITWSMGALVIVFMMSGCGKGDDTHVDPAKLRAAKKRAETEQIQQEQAAAKTAEEAYVRKVTPLLDMLIRVESDLQSGISHQDYVRRMADLNFELNKTKPTLSVSEGERKSLATMLKAIDEFREARGWWDSELTPMTTNFDDSTLTPADRAMRRANSQFEYLRDTATCDKNKHDHWQKAIALVQSAQQQLQEKK